MIPPARQRRFAQVSLLLLLVLPSIGVSPLLVEGITFAMMAGSLLLRDAALLGLVAYFVWSDGEEAATIGWRRDGYAHEILLGAGLFLPVLLGLSLLQALLIALGMPPPVPPPAALMPAGMAEYGLALILLVVVAITEETLFRGFLITRLLALGGGRVVALALSTLIFSIGHGYQGVTGVVAVASLGLLYAVIFLWRGSLVAPAVLHFLQNATGMFILGGE
jgi:membrane protease YdiL (CAAX protease family)